jgi:cytidylate kinase
MQYRNNALDNILKEESWIVEGVYYRWVAQAFKDADLIIILTTSKWIRHLRISRRFIKRKLGIMSSKKEKLRDFKDLVKWNHKFDSDNLIRIRKFISDHENKIVECKEIQDVLKIIYNT